MRGRYYISYNTIPPARARLAHMRQIRRETGAARKSGHIVRTKIPYSACMNSFRIQRLDSFHAISHGIPVRPADPAQDRRAGLIGMHPFFKKLE
eukprot:COSAG02_NODE_1498_length_12281_cov_14.846741_10_plen_94_part_00